MPQTADFLVVGAGFSGAVLARELAERLRKNITVVDQRPHLAGNCHTMRDEATQIMLHVYGPHIFNTDSVEAWNYVQRFGKFRRFVNRVMAKTPRGIFSLPINLLTINQFFGKQFNPAEAKAFMDSQGISFPSDPKNLEEQALKVMGRELYEAFFYGYTCKQWGCEPRELPASILRRFPIRFDYNDSYYTTVYQGIPENGYSSIVENILDHPLIEVRLNTPFSPKDVADYRHVFYTGPIDAYFGFDEGRLGYRTVGFERIDAVGDYQGNAVINHTGMDTPYTRIHEHKHLAPWETHERTVAFKEFSKATGSADAPYYPMRRATDMATLALYAEQAQALKNISFLGRLATYRYLDMDDVIDEALILAKLFILSETTGSPRPTFGVDSLG